MEQIGAIASPRIRWADPKAPSRRHRCVRVPRHFRIAGQAEHARQIIVPAMFDAVSIRPSVLRKKIIVLTRKHLGSQAPLFQIVEANGSFCSERGAVQHRKQ